MAVRRAAPACSRSSVRASTGARRAARTASASRAPKREPPPAAGNQRRAARPSQSAVRAAARSAPRRADENPSARRSATRRRCRDGSRSRCGSTPSARRCPRSAASIAVPDAACPAKPDATLTSSSLATSVPRDVEIARHTTHAPTRPPRAPVARVREPHEADFGPRQEQVERALERRARRRRRTRPPTRDSARRRRRNAPSSARASARVAAVIGPQRIAARRWPDRRARRAVATAPHSGDRRSGASAARMRAGTSAGRCVARSTHTCTKRPVAAAASPPRAEQRDLVGDRRVRPRRATRRPASIVSGKRQRADGSGRTSRRPADAGPVADVEAARADQVLVHHGVEVGVVRDVVHVAVRVVVHPARGDREEVRGSRRGARVAAASRHRHAAPGRATRPRCTFSIRASSSSIQCRTGRARAGLEMRQAADVRGDDHLRPRRLERRELVRPSARRTAPAAGSSTCPRSRSTGARRRPAAASGRSRAGSPRPALGSSCRAAACTANGTRPAARRWSIAISGAIFFHSRRRRSRSGRARASAILFAFAAYAASCARKWP